MKAVIQRVSRASVSVAGELRAGIGQGLLVLLGVAAGDASGDAAFIAGKVARLRIFPDSQGLMNLSVADVRGSVLLVSQFTLLGDARKGNRPSFTAAAPPEPASALYERVCELLRRKALPVEQGVFRAHMEVELLNDGPVTILLETP